jgi:hypothetical protein
MTVLCYAPQPCGLSPQTLILTLNCFAGGGGSLQLRLEGGIVAARGIQLLL